MNYFRKAWNFLKEDTWQSWIVSLILAFVIIKFVFFPVLSLVFMTPLPLVVVESCSMYHSDDFESWWEQNSLWYEGKGIEKEDFKEYPMRNGLNKGDIILVSGRGNYELGDIIIFETGKNQFPIIHRVVDLAPFGTKGDNGNTNPGQLEFERIIEKEDILGKAVIRVPGLGWIKLIFFEPLRPGHERGFCS